MFYSMMLHEYKFHENSSSARFRLVFLAFPRVFIFGGFSLFLFLFQQIGKWWDKQMISNLFLHLHRSESRRIMMRMALFEANEMCFMLLRRRRRDSNEIFQCRKGSFVVILSFLNKLFHYPLCRTVCALMVNADVMFRGWIGFGFNVFHNAQQLLLHSHSNVYTSILTDEWKIS